MEAKCIKTNLQRDFHVGLFFFFFFVVVVSKHNIGSLLEMSKTQNWKIVEEGKREKHQGWLYGYCCRAEGCESWYKGEAFGNSLDFMWRLLLLATMSSHKLA